LASEDLIFFQAISGSRSLADAARFLGVSAAAVTERLKNLETRIGVRLLDRSGRRMLFTDEGELLRTRAKTVLAELAALEEEIAPMLVTPSSIGPSSETLHRSRHSRRTPTAANVASVPYGECFQIRVADLATVLAVGGKIVVDPELLQVLQESGLLRRVETTKRELDRARIMREE
jgi:hypothetical protein